jgi:hypothetical protein
MSFESVWVRSNGGDCRRADQHGAPWPHVRFDPSVVSILRSLAALDVPSRRLISSKLREFQVASPEFSERVVDYGQSPRTWNLRIAVLRNSVESRLRVVGSIDATSNDMCWENSRLGGEEEDDTRLHG